MEKKRYVLKCLGKSKISTPTNSDFQMGKAYYAEYDKDLFRIFLDCETRGEFEETIIDNPLEIMIFEASKAYITLFDYKWLIICSVCPMSMFERYPNQLPEEMMPWFVLGMNTGTLM